MLIIADENVPKSLIQVLEKMGVEVYSVTELGLSGLNDYQILKFANEHSAIILTMDVKDFSRLHRDGFNQTGIIVVLSKSLKRNLFQVAEKIVEYLEVLYNVKPWIVFV